MSSKRNVRPSTDVAASSFDYVAFGWQHIKVVLLADRGVLVVTLDRPERHNAFSGDMAKSLCFAFQTADQDDRVKVIVLTGAGKSFCAGADLSHDGFGVDSTAPLEQHRDGGGQVVLQMLDCSKLIIAAINGNAVGIGLTMTFAADLRIIADKAKVGAPFAKRGIPCDALSSYLLPRLIGHSNATKVLLAGDLLLPSSPAIASLFLDFVPQLQVLDRAMLLAERLAAENSILSMALIKAQLSHPYTEKDDGQSRGEAERVHELESLALAWTAVHGDAQEGVQSFLQKRPASFQPTLQRLQSTAWWPWWQSKRAKL